MTQTSSSNVRQTPSDQSLQRAVRSIVAVATYSENTDGPFLDLDDETLVGTGLSYHKHVIPGNDKGPTPDNVQYATVLQRDFELEGTAYHSTKLLDPDNPADSRIEITSTQNVTGYWSVQWYRTCRYRNDNDEEIQITARDRVVQFVQWCHSQIGLQYMERIGLSFQECTDLSQTDADRMSGWEERGTVDLVLSYQQQLVQETDYIDTVPLEVSNFKEAEAWVSGTDYNLGDYVSRNEMNYRATIDHTSTAENAPDADGQTEWELASPGILIESAE